MQNRLTNQTWLNIAATPASFSLAGGLYGITATATWGGGTVTLQRLAPDASTYIATPAAFAADAYLSVYLPSGTYRLAIASASAVYADVVGIVETP
jgi:hypothetical protein